MVPSISDPVPVSVVVVVPALKNWLDPATAVGGILPPVAKGNGLPFPELYKEVTSAALNTLPHTPTSSIVPGNPAVLVDKFLPSPKSKLLNTTGVPSVADKVCAPLR
jgi:hypothetical protein